MCVTCRLSSCHVASTVAYAMQLASQAGMLLHPAVAAALVFAVVGPTVFNFSAMAYSSKKLKPSISSAYITLQPILVAVLSLALFGKVLSADECTAGLVVVLGLYLSVIGNPQLDRDWKEYVSDLPTNVPQTLANAADATIDVAHNVADATVDAAKSISETVADTVLEAAAAVTDAVSKAAGSLTDSANGAEQDQPPR
jgi:EamA-like transporter family